MPINQERSQRKYSCVHIEFPLSKWMTQRSVLFCFPGFTFFAIGVADADYSELVNIGSKPSERHVFFVDDFDAFTKIEDELITFVCETASAS